MIKIAFIAFVTLLVIALLFFRGVLAPQASKQWDFINFETLKLKQTPNQFLVCSKEQCSADYQQEAKIYPYPRDSLIQTWQNAVNQRPNMELLGEDVNQKQFVYIEYSKFWRFPDFIYVQFYELSPESSTLAIYSFSVFGHSDLGVNKKRVKEILAAIKQSFSAK